MSGRPWNDDRYYGGGGRGPPPPPRHHHHHHRNGPPPPFPPPHQRGPRGPPPPPPRGGPIGGGGGRRRGPPGTIIFHSYDEEREWVEDRRRKRMARPSKFTDAAPDPASIAATAVAAVYTDTLPQQTRHARRLYVGNLPPMINEQQIHQAFRHSIQTAIDPTCGVDVSKEDPILSVYINHERRFCFLEFKTVEMCNACMELDGLEVVPGQPPVKVKRPNDYNQALAPVPTHKIVLDVSKLGIVSSTVLDGPNKIFIGGLHYHLVESQVLELLAAFGKVKAFHLVKSDPDSPTSKGYCFVEYADPSVTPIAVQGLNGMDIGGGKSLTARLAGQRANPVVPPIEQKPEAPPASLPGAPPPNHTIVCGYDVEALVDAALGMGPMPSAPQYLDTYGQPLTRIVPIVPVPMMPANNMPSNMPPNMQMMPIHTNMQMVPMHNNMQMAPMAAPMAANMTAPLTNQTLAETLQQLQQQQQQQPQQTRILVLLNMVSDEDLATASNHQELMEEVREECAKYGTLNSIKIPRLLGDGIELSAIRKVYLEYVDTNDAIRAEKELKGRQFGPNTVETEFFNEDDYLAGRLH